VEVIYYRHGESGASILDAASVNLNLRQDGRPKGGDGLPAPFTTAVSLQGRRRKRNDNIHISGRIIKTIASRRMKNSNQLTKRQELHTTTRWNKAGSASVQPAYSAPQACGL